MWLHIWDQIKVYTLTRFTCEQGRVMQGRKEGGKAPSSDFVPDEPPACSLHIPLASPVLGSQKLLLSGNLSAWRFSACPPPRLEPSPTWFPRWQRFGLVWLAGRWCCSCSALTFLTPGPALGGGHRFAGTDPTLLRGGLDPH